MGKKFEARVSKRDRETIDLSDKLSRDLYALANEEFLKGAQLDEIELSSIVVKEQVRTKFNDNSLRELAENIKLNGLIQPLVLHREKGKLTLICGERRFRAMALIEKKTAPCFILENKNHDELMAIQFSENSSREELHYIDKAEGILNYQNATKASERKIMKALGISKSEVHRSLLIAKMPKNLREAAKNYNVEKYVLVEWDVIDNSTIKKELLDKILSGEIKKRAQLKKALSGTSSKGPKLADSKTNNLKRGTSASAFLRAMEVKKKKLDLDPETMKALEKLVEETKEMMDF